MDQMLPTPNLEPEGKENLPMPVESAETPPFSVEKAPVPSGSEKEKPQGDKVAQAYYGAPEPTIIPLAPVQPVIPVEAPAQAQPTMTSDYSNPDVVDKAVIEKAKSIVGQNRDDPHKQSNELAKYKDQVISDRFGKVRPDNQAAA